MSTEQKGFEELAPPILESLGWCWDVRIKVWRHSDRCLPYEAEEAVALSAWEIQQAVLGKDVALKYWGGDGTYCLRAHNPKGKDYMKVVVADDITMLWLKAYAALRERVV